MLLSPLATAAPALFLSAHRYLRRSNVFSRELAPDQLSRAPPLLTPSLASPAQAGLMDLRSVFAPACTLSLHKSFLQGVEIQPFLHFEKPNSGSRRVTAKCGHHPIHGVLKTEEIDDSTLVDVQESTDGYVLFKFGTTRLYDDPPRFISSVGPVKGQPTHTEADNEVIDCSAVVYRLPNESNFSTSYDPWRYPATPLHDGSSSGFPHESIAQVPRLTVSSDRSLDLPLDFVGPRSWADHLVSEEVRIESFARFLRSSSTAAAMVKRLPANITIEDVSTQLTPLSPEVVQSMKTSTIKRADRAGKKSRAQHKKPARDLYRSSSFQMYELIFCYPFMDSSKASSSWKSIPKDKYAELFGVLNQISVGLAGGGLALVLFVASRMLCLNATFDGIKAMFLLRGVGLLWLSSSLQKFGSVVRHMAECGEKARDERKEHLAMLKKEVHSVTLKVCTMLMLSVLRLA